MSQSREERIQPKMQKEDYLLLTRTNCAGDKTIKTCYTICILLKRPEYPVLRQLDLVPPLPGPSHPDSFAPSKEHACLSHELPGSPEECCGKQRQIHGNHCHSSAWIRKRKIFSLPIALCSIQKLCAVNPPLLGFHSFIIS